MNLRFIVIIYKAFTDVLFQSTRNFSLTVIEKKKKSIQLSLNITLSNLVTLNLIKKKKVLNIAATFCNRNVCTKLGRIFFFLSFQKQFNWSACWYKH